MCGGGGATLARPPRALSAVTRAICDGHKSSRRARHLRTWPRPRRTLCGPPPEGLGAARGGWACRMACRGACAHASPAGRGAEELLLRGVPSKLPGQKLAKCLLAGFVWYQGVVERNGRLLFWECLKRLERPFCLFDCFCGSSSINTPRNDHTCEAMREGARERAASLGHLWVPALGETASE